MFIKQIILKIDQDISFTKELFDFANNQNTIALVFINDQREFWQKKIPDITSQFPECSFIGCTTSGHIIDELIYDNELVITFMKLEKTQFKINMLENVSGEDSFLIGKKISLEAPYSNGSCMILSEGLHVNGSKLVEGMINEKSNLKIFGGLSGDADKFQSTAVIFKNKLYSNSIIAVYFDENLSIERQIGGGHTPFGIERTVTKSVDNVVYEFDHTPAIQLYEEYLGEKASLLPAYGLHFPVCHHNEKSELVTRTLLGINRADGSLTYAGDVNLQSKIRLMKTDNQDLIKASQTAIDKITQENKSSEDVLLFEVSCVGRRLVLGQMTEDECAMEEKPKNIYTAGFYSYGEINRSFKSEECSFHNQTFTVTCLKEKK
jgi:hypothetical protein